MRRSQRPFVLAAAPEAGMDTRESHMCDRNNRAIADEFRDDAGINHLPATDEGDG
jgi:hypothetical protein